MSGEEGAAHGFPEWGGPTPRRPLLALLLLLPIPSLGCAAGMWWWPDTVLAKFIYGLSKLLLIAFPLIWHFFVDRGQFRRPRLSGIGVREGVLSGLVLCLLIVLGSGLALKYWVDAGEIRRQLTALGYGGPLFFLLMALYWSTVNAVLEEMVWRWFFLRQLHGLFRRKSLVLLLSAAGFTLHHLVVVSAWLPMAPTLLVNFGIFCAGLHWSALTLRHRSLLPACISHILADLALMGVGTWILFAP